MTTEDKFTAAVHVINSLPKNGPFQPSQSLVLKLQAYEKQAVEGPCNTPKPSLLNSERHKWHEWKKLGNMPKQMAMKKYIEELSKVVETMSYTEAVSKFMDIMYPFYEMVWIDDTDSDETHAAPEMKEEHDVETLSETHHMAEFVKVQNEVSVPLENASHKENLPLQPYQEGRIATTPDRVKLFIDGYQETSETTEGIIDIRRSASVLNPESKYSKEILTSSVLNLQKSLDAIVDHLSSLEQMAETYRNDLEKVSPNKPKDKNWKFSPFAVLFILSWPVIAYWLLHVFQRRRSTIRNR